MKVLITGAAGFLGSHLCDRFLVDGHEVVGLDNLVTGSEENLAHLASEPRFRFVRHDISTPTDIDGPLDGVLHFASPASPVDYLELPIETLKVGSRERTRRSGWREEKSARFFLASTSEVYGDPLVHPQTRGVLGQRQPDRPARRVRRGQAVRRSDDDGVPPHHGVDTRIVRIFNTYGPRMRPQRRPRRVQLHRPGAAGRAADGLRRWLADAELLLRVRRGGGNLRLFHDGDAQPMNIGNPVEYTVRQLAELVVELTGSRSPIVEAPLPVDDPKVRRPDITRARSVLGWEPSVPVREGLARTIEYFAAHVSSPRMAPRQPRPRPEAGGTR